MVVVKRALISCFDKTGLAEFAKGLAALGVELIGSTGTAMFLKQHGLAAQTVEAFTGSPEQLDGRVKTLHPKIFAGILARRDDPAHVETASAALIDLVAVNLYPFQETTKRSNVELVEALEQIDIGGVALLRAAAKNFPHVAVVSHPDQYAPLLAVLAQRGACLPEEESRRLAAEAFCLTSDYDAAIRAFLQGAAKPTSLPETLTVRVSRHQPLRYGENPHQQAGWYTASGSLDAGLARLVQFQGKEFSYNNLLDLDAALRCLGEFEPPTCVIVKHAAPCGVACAASAEAAYQHALQCDEESAFGGIVALNRPLDAKTASAMKALFLELVAAPRIEEDARAILSKKPNLRVVQWAPSPDVSSVAWRSILGGWLIQDEDRVTLDRSAARVVTVAHPTEETMRDLTFAWTVAKHARSNAVVIAQREATAAIGQGQPSRVRAVRQAIAHAGDRARGAVLASDGFFPFPDSIELAAQAGIRAIVQPGGSVKDTDAIAAANRAGLAMVFTGIRHFRH